MKSVLPINNYYIDLSEYVFPLNLDQIFPISRPTALEIGFGEGEFIVDIASRKSNRNYVGIEIKRGRFKKALKKAASSNIQNLRLINTEAHLAVKQVFAENCFHTVLINFPDPWPKSRHSKHRLFNTEFVYNLSRILNRNGKVKVKTDHKNYISDILVEMENGSLFRIEHFNSGFKAFEHNEIETKFEKDFKNEGRQIYTATFTNISD